MSLNRVPEGRQLVSKLKQQIARRWPEAIRPVAGRSPMIFHTGLERLDKLFPLGGIPHGQLVEITGAASSGKTGLLWHMLGHWTIDYQVAYVDFGNALSPDAAIASGVDLSKLLVVKLSDQSDDRLKAGLRTAELLLRERRARILLFDLVGQPGHLPINLLHRLRQKIVRAQGLVLFLTQGESTVIPSSMTSLRLHISRADMNALQITITKSRITTEGTRVEVIL